MIRIRIPVISLALIALAAGQATAQRGGPSMRGDGPAPESAPFSVTRADSALDAIVPPDAALELLASGFGLNEGPVWVPEGESGYLLVSGLLDNVIYRIAADNTVSVFMERAGYSGTDVNNTGAQTRSGRSHVLLIGPSCTGLDSQGRLIWCADNDRTLMRLEPDGTRTVLSAGAPDGRRFSGPNDMASRPRSCALPTSEMRSMNGVARTLPFCQILTVPCFSAMKRRPSGATTASISPTTTSACGAPARAPTRKWTTASG